MSEGWDWSLTDRARRQFDALDDYGRERISSKLELADEIASESKLSAKDAEDLAEDLKREIGAHYSE